MPSVRSSAAFRAASRREASGGLALGAGMGYRNPREEASHGAAGEP